MLNDVFIVQSAISAFNNAALRAPAFLWWAILAMPLFWFVYRFGREITEKLGWAHAKIVDNSSMLTVVLTAGWVVLFGGSYGVLRDGASLLPFMTAVILFVACLFIGSRTRDMGLPKWRAHGRGWRFMACVMAVVSVALVACSGMYQWWGPLLQVCAVFGGLILGRVARGAMRVVPGTLLIIMATVTAIMMQPEYFRFGQLGALTVAHLMAIMLIGAAAAATLALRNINPRGRIYRSAYIKLKWMVRFVSLFGIALFGLTESVPVFLAATASLFVLFSLSVWHADDVPAHLADKMFALALMLFGAVTVMPVVSVTGLLIWTSCPTSHRGRDFRFLL